MSWLDEILGEMVKDLPADAFTDWSFGFADMQRVVSLVEKAVERNALETAEAGRAAALKAAADPSHSFMKNPILAPMGLELGKASMTFPRILRSAMLIAIYSQTEFLLLSWCESMSEDPALSKRLRKTSNKGESYPGRYLRYLRDDGAFAFGDFTTWPEWEAIDGYRLARNALAHRGGVVDDGEDWKKIAALPHIDVDDTDLELNDDDPNVERSEPMVRLLPGACEAAIETAQAFVGRAITIAGRDPRWDGPPPPT
jgi:hypothetical protein